MFLFLQRMNAIACERDRKNQSNIAEGDFDEE